MVKLYRDSYGIYACSGILFNHESPKRGENFVTRKITKYIGQLISGKVKDKLKLGNLESFRDWGHAKDYVEAMRMMLNKDEAKDYVIATGETHSVKDFLQESFGYVNLDYKDHVEIDPDLYRPAEVDYLLGDATRAKLALGWTPQISFTNLVKEMVYSDIRLFSE
jgi:GDPmannose 4,6-dehydratase